MTNQKPNKEVPHILDLIELDQDGEWNFTTEYDLVKEKWLYKYAVISNQGKAKIYSF